MYVPLLEAYILSQQKYILEFLKRTKMEDSKPFATPIESHNKFSILDGTLMDDPTLYHHTIGALQYVYYSSCPISPLQLIRPLSLCTKPQISIEA